MSRSPLIPFVTVERELVAECRVFRVERVRRRSGATGIEHDFFQLATASWVNVVAITPGDELVLVRQERHGVADFTLELPGGLVDPGEDPANAALRELREETGFAAREVEPLGWVHPNPALQANRCYTFLATGVELAGSQQLDQREEIEVVTVPLHRVRELVRRGDITHSLVISALYLHELRSDG